MPVVWDWEARSSRAANLALTKCEESQQGQNGLRSTPPSVCTRGYLP